LLGVQVFSSDALPQFELLDKWEEHLSDKSILEWTLFDKWEDVFERLGI
jgi:hypothetical protein